MNKLNDYQKDFIVTLLRAHAEGLSGSWWDSQIGWHDECVEQEYQDCHDILRALGEE
jgi:hypothetical protein